MLWAGPSGAEAAWASGGEGERVWAEVWAGADWSGGLPGERKWAAGLGCWVGSFGFLSFSISLPFPSTQNLFEFK